MLWAANSANSANSPSHVLPNFAANVANRTNFFQNTTPSAFVNNSVVGTYGVTNTMVMCSEVGNPTSNASHVVRFLTPGWWVTKQGMGPVIKVNIGTPGSGYSNNDMLHVTATALNTTNATANVSTNATGGVVNFTNLSGGLFINASSTTVAITNTTGGTANGTGFAGTPTFGGRAGRIQRECLVAVPSMTAASAGNPNTAMFPSS